MGKHWPRVLPNGILEASDWQTQRWVTEQAIWDPSQGKGEITNHCNGFPKRESRQATRSPSSEEDVRRSPPSSAAERSAAVGTHATQLVTDPSELEERLLGPESSFPSPSPSTLSSRSLYLGDSYATGWHEHPQPHLMPEELVPGQHFTAVSSVFTYPLTGASQAG